MLTVTVTVIKIYNYTTKTCTLTSITVIKNNVYDDLWLSYVNNNFIIDIRIVLLLYIENTKLKLIFFKL